MFLENKAWISVIKSSVDKTKFVQAIYQGITNICPHNHATCAGNGMGGMDDAIACFETL